MDRTHFPCIGRRILYLTELPGKPRNRDFKEVTKVKCGNPLQYSCWRIPGTGKSGGQPSMGSHRVGHNLATEQQHVRDYSKGFKDINSPNPHNIPMS